MKIFSFFSDVLRRLETLSEKLHSPFHGNKESIFISAMEYDEEDVRFRCNQSVFRLYRNGDNFM
jgi:hypothetical protein